MVRGRDVYNYRCYFCHGYDGDARTEAAAALSPPPRDFLAADTLERAEIVDALRKGRRGTAMKSFTRLLSPQEIQDVATFVAETFVACGRANAAYHTAENGWPDHAERYGAAFPFVRGEIALDAPARLLDAQARRGRELFVGACVSCHEGRRAGAGAPTMAAESGAAHDPWAPHEEEDYEARTVHDYAPEIPDIAPIEARGRDLYARACELCHAADGSGRNWIGRFLDPSPPDMRDAAFARAFDAGRFARVTLDGLDGTTMPSFVGVLSDGDAAAIAAYVERAFVAPAR